MTFLHPDSIGHSAAEERRRFWAPMGQRVDAIRHEHCPECSRGDVPRITDTGMVVHGYGRAGDITLDGRGICMGTRLCRAQEAVLAVARVLGCRPADLLPVVS